MSLALAGGGLLAPCASSSRSGWGTGELKRQERLLQGCAQIKAVSRACRQSDCLVLI